MAKKSAAKKKTAPAAKAKSSTPVRKTPVPKTVKAVKKTTIATVAAIAPTFDQIAKRAYELYASGSPGSEADHWFRAERELRTGV